MGPTSVRADASARAVWDAQAPRYGRQEAREERAIGAALRLAAAGRDERLVDLGTGTGLLLRRLAATVGPPARAVGVDRSASMLARAGTLPVGWRLVRADAAATGLPRGTADVVTCAYVLQLLDGAGRRAVLAEARRLLDGSSVPRVVVVVPWADRSRLAPAGLGWAMGAVARASPGRLGGLHPLDPGDDLRAAGFAVERGVVLPRRGYPSLVVRARPLDR